MRFVLVLLALPFALLFTLMAVLHVEPPLGPLTPIVVAEPGRPNIVGSLIVFGLWALALISAGAQVRRIIQATRAGARLGAMSVDLALAGVTLLFVVGFIAGIVVDQYPCWVGVPNCD
jgi:hypothetical protein